MKKLSDYTGEEAITLWADLMDKFTEILSDTEVADTFRKKTPALLKARVIMKNKPKEAGELLLRIDPAPLNGANVITRLVAIINEIIHDPEMAVFFESASVRKNSETSSGSATENTEVVEE